jgi:hypothetical protein
MVSGPPVPVVEIAIDGESVRALVSTATDLTVVDDRIADDPKLLDRVELGPIAIGRVPALVRDLDPIERQLGTPIGAVIGLDLLRHFETTIDFAQRWVVVRREGTEAGESVSARYATLAGSFLAVYATLDRTEGWLVIDSAGLFPIALSPAAVSALELDVDSLEAPPSAPAPDVRLTAIDALRISDFELRGVPAVTGLVPRDLDALAGTPLAGMLGAIASTSASSSLPRRHAGSTSSDGLSIRQSNALSPRPIERSLRELLPAREPPDAAARVLDPLHDLRARRSARARDRGALGGLLRRREERARGREVGVPVLAFVVRAGRLPGADRRGHARSRRPPRARRR